jgi:hypothetical protein
MARKYFPIFDCYTDRDCIPVRAASEVRIGRRNDKRLIGALNKLERVLLEEVDDEGRHIRGVLSSQRIQKVEAEVEAAYEAYDWLE